MDHVSYIVEKACYDILSSANMNISVRETQRAMRQMLTAVFKCYGHWYEMDLKERTANTH